MQKITLLLFFTAFFIFFSALTLTRYYSFQVFFYDFGIFARILWQLAHFQAPYINHIALGKVFFLGDHFNPSLGLLAPLFWFTNDLRVVLLEQAFVTTLSGLVIYLIARKYNLNHWLSLGMSFVFLIFAGTQNPLVTDWHPEPTAGLFLLLFYYFFAFTERKWLSYLFAIIFLGFKESNPVTLSFLLVFFYFHLPLRKKETMGLLIFCVLWFIITIRMIMPAISGKNYLYTPVFPQSLNELMATVFQPTRLNFVYISLVSFGFLPLVAGFGIIPLLGEFAIRLLPVEAKYDLGTLGSHYNVYLGIFLAISTIYVFRYLLKKKASSFVIYGLLLYLLGTSLFAARKITISPINLAINKVFWSQLSPNTELKTLVEQVPKTGSIMSQNSLLPHLVTRRDEVYLTTRQYNRILPDIILFDLTEGQNPNNQWSSDAQYLPAIQKRLERDTRYIRISTANPLHFLYLKK